MVELIENAADPAHFEFLHNRMTVPFTQIPQLRVTRRAVNQGP